MAMNATVIVTMVNMDHPINAIHNVQAIQAHFADQMKQSVFGPLSKKVRLIILKRS